jgi:hypothetical protein
MSNSGQYLAPANEGQAPDEQRDGIADHLEIGKDSD